MGTYPFPSHVQPQGVSLYHHGSDSYMYMRELQNSKWVVSSPHQRGCTSRYVGYLETSPLWGSCRTKGLCIKTY